MAKKGMDFGKVKEFMIAKGERAALGVCLLIGVALLVKGVLSGMANSKTDWETPFVKGAQAVDTAVASAEPEAEGKALSAIPIWQRDSRPLWLPYTTVLPITEVGKRSRTMPRALPVIEISKPENATIYPHSHGMTVLSEHKDAQVDFLLAGARTYETNLEGEKYTKIVAGQEAGRMAEILRPKRLIVVQLAYNFKKQIKEFADALGITEKELLSSNDPTLLPRVVGLDIVRLEMAPGAQKWREVKIYEFQPHEIMPGRMYKVRPKALDDLFRTMLHDHEYTESVRDHIFIGLVSPVPQLLTGPLEQTKGRKDLDKRIQYPEIRLEGIKQNKDMLAGVDPVGPADPKGGMPNLGGFKGMPKGKQGGEAPGGIEVGGGAGGSPVDFPFKDLRAENYSLWYRFKMHYFPFDPYGELPTGQKGPAGGVPGPGGPGPALPGPGTPPMPGVGPGMPGTGRFKQGRPEGGGRDEGENVEPLEQQSQFDVTRLIRFIDVDVMPGYTYAYSVQVQLANPYFGRPGADTDEWRKDKLLPKPSPPAFTPAVKIPAEFFYYAVDQTDRVSDLTRGNDVKAADQDKMPVQIQRWVQALDKKVIGDWVVSERLLVRRGDVIGRRLEFSIFRDKDITPDMIAAEVPYWDETQGARGEFRMNGDWVDDKKGGKKFKATGLPMIFQLPNRPPPLLVDFEGGKRHDTKLSLKDDSAYEMLILDTDGRLILRNSLADTADAERVRRYDHWRTRVRQYHAGRQAPVGDGLQGGPGMPTAPGPGGAGPRGG